jgi:peptidoglycan hydrolase CwlO-like protein
MQSIQYKIWNMQSLKQELERDCYVLQQQKMELTDTLNTLQQSFDISAQKVSNLYKERYWLEQSIASHKGVLLS